MANYENLKSAIKSVIKANGNQEIMGDIMQQTLLTIIDVLGKGYQFMGGATPATDPGTPDQKVCYLAMQQGVYPNFHDLEVGNDEIAIMMYDSQWQGITITMGNKQDKIDDNLQTNSKEIVGAINEVYNGGVKDKSITSEKIANEAITKEKLGPKAVTISRIADAAIITPKIKDEAVTEPKLSRGLQDKVNNNVKTSGQALTVAQMAQARKNIGIPYYVTFNSARQLTSAVGNYVKYAGESAMIIDKEDGVLNIDSNILEVDFCGATLEIKEGIKGHAKCKLKNLTIIMVPPQETSNRVAIEGFGYVENVYVTTEKDGTHKIAYGFKNCDHLFNCKVDGSAKNNGEDGVATGFYYCDYLFQCRYSGWPKVTYCSGFEHCKFISQCYMKYGYEVSSFKYSLGNNRHVESLIGISMNGDIPVFETFADTSHIHIGDYNMDNFIKLISSDGGTGKTKLYAKPDDKSGIATVLLDTTPINWAVARRTATGTLKAKDAVEEDDTVTKKQLDSLKMLAEAVKAFGAIELKASDDATNKTVITTYLKILTDAGVSTANGYSVPVRITGNSQEYHGMLNIGTGVLLSGVVTDVNENHHYPFNVSTTDGVITFDENNYFLEKTSNEVTEMLDAIKYSHTSVPFTDTTLSNKAQLEVFLSKVPDATVMHCTYKEIWAGTLHKINGDWYGLLVKNTNSPADNINIKLSADGTVITSNSTQ